jgi:anti-sigma factor RsiW
MGAMAHWLHMSTGRGRRLAAYAAGDLAGPQRARAEAAVSGCPGCRREIEAHRRVAQTLRATPRVTLTDAEAGAFWSGVERRIETRERPHRIPARPALREMLWDHPRLSLASAAAAAVLVVGITLTQMGGWLSSSNGFPNGVEVVSVEGGSDAPVMLFQMPGSSLKVIWVFEEPTAE